MHSRFSVALAGIVSLAVAGCAGTSVTPGPANPVPQAVNKKAYANALYVSDFSSNNDIKILTNTSYAEFGSITNGISNPIGLSMDRSGNLYVANFGSGSGGDVTEYAPGGTSPSFTYNANMHFTSNVTVDRHGNVYETDATNGGGIINEYRQGKNAVIHSCVLTNYISPLDVAVDANGDVFVGTQLNGMYEYTGGLSSCSSTHLNSIAANGLALDSNNNLIVTDDSTLAVEVVDPPYTSVSRTIGSGFAFPVGLSMNKANSLVFVTDFNNDTVTAINYQTGQNVTVLSGASYGITQAAGVVDAPNAVY